MKKVHVVVYSALLLLFISALSQAQQSLASTRNSDSNAGSQTISNVSGMGTKDYVPLWLSGSKLGNSNIFQSPAGIGIGTTAPAAALDVSGAVNAATSFNLRGSPFAFGTLSKQNAFVGFSGNSSMTGGANTASGVQALQGNTKGAENTASGVAALALNISGGGNTATGWDTLANNISGVLNTATGGAALGIEQQQDQIAQLILQVKTIQASLKTNSRSDSEVRTVKADLTTVLQCAKTGSRPSREILITNARPRRTQTKTYLEEP